MYSLKSELALFDFGEYRLAVTGRKYLANGLEYYSSVSTNVTPNNVSSLIFEGEFIL